MIFTRVLQWTSFLGNYHEKIRRGVQVHVAPGGDGARQLDASSSSLRNGSESSRENARIDQAIITGDAPVLEEGTAYRCPDLLSGGAGSRTTGRAI